MLHGVEQLGLSVVFHSLHRLHLQHLAGLLSVGQHDGDFIRLDVIDVSPVQYAFSCIGSVFCLVGIEIHHVAPAEVGQKTYFLSGHTQRYPLRHIVALHTCLGLDGQSHIDVPRFYLFSQRHVPQVCHATAHPLLRAHFRQQLFTIHEGHHAAEVFPLQWRHGLQWLGDLFYLRQQIAVVEHRVVSTGVERFGRQHADDAVKAMAGDVIVGGHDMVAQSNGFKKQVAVKGHRHEPQLRWVSRIEQMNVSVPVVQTEVVSQHSII